MFTIGIVEKNESITGSGRDTCMVLEGTSVANTTSYKELSTLCAINLITTFSLSLIVVIVLVVFP